MLQKSLFFICAGIACVPCAFGMAFDDGPSNDVDGTSAESIFMDRIMPIFRSKDPSSCVQCHLSSVDLKNYILPSHEKTFASLRDQGLINLDAPGKSKILKLIRMGDKDADKGAKLIHEKMRRAEYEAFASWVEACCLDDRIRNLPAIDVSELARPDKPNEVIRHARKSRVVESFVRNVWSQRMRCFPCHTPHEIGPRQKGARKKFEKWENEYGDQMRIFKATPELTVQHLVNESKRASDDYLPLLNLKDPSQSLIVLKPTAKLPPKMDGVRVPTYTTPIYHMGGLKMHTDDHSYKAFISWIKDYSKVTRGEYTSVKDLPNDNWLPTKKVIRMRDVPESWKVGTPVQLFVYKRLADDSGWTTKPVAFTQGTITPRRIVNGPLFLLAPADTIGSERWQASKQFLNSGDFLVKVFLDSDNRIADDPTLMLGKSNLQGEVEVTDNNWRIGFKNATWISAAQFK